MYVRGTVRSFVQTSDTAGDRVGRIPVSITGFAILLALLSTASNAPKSDASRGYPFVIVASKKFGYLSRR